LARLSLVEKHVETIIHLKIPNYLNKNMQCLFFQLMFIWEITEFCQAVEKSKGHTSNAMLE
jgi:hypothetical protein